METLLLTLIVFLLGLIATMLGFAGKYLYQLLGAHERKINWLLTRHYHCKGEQP